MKRLIKTVVIAAAFFVVSAVPALAEQGIYKSDEVIVKFRTSASQTQMDIADRHAKGHGRRRISGVQQVKLDAGTTVASALISYSNDPAVEYVEPNYILSALITPNDPSYSSQWNMAKIGAATAWDTYQGSNTVKIAIIDTGVSTTHPDLAAKIVAGYDFVSDDSNPTDENGHGTHVAGIAAAISNNGTGVAGVDWNARIMPVRVLDATGNGSSLDVADGIKWAADNGAKVINLSLGGTVSDTTIQTQINYAYGKGVVVVAAAGNEAEKGNPIFYPASGAHVISVAATTPSDTRATYSNYNSSVDVAAPGGTSVSPLSDNIYSTYWSGGVNGYTYEAGTSMACPHVAGLASLLAGLHPTWTPDQIEARIESTAKDLGTAGKDNNFGYGRIDVAAAVGIQAGVLEYITISPAAASVSAHGTQVFTAQGYDGYDDPVAGLVYSWSTTAGSVSPTSGASTTLTAQNTAATGKSVTVTSGTKTASVTVDIIAGSLNHIDLTPASASVAAGVTRAFTAQGQDVYHNNISGLTYTWTTDAGSINPSTGSSTTLTAQTTAAIGKEVTVTSGSIHTDAAVTIVAGPLSQIILTPASASVAAGVTQPFTAQGQDVYHNNISGLTYTWTTDAGSVSPSTGASTTLTAQTAAATGKRVTVTSGTVSLYATVNIVAGPIDHLALTPTIVSVLLNGSQGFSVQGQDAYNNNISSLTYTWAAIRGSTSPGTGSSTTYTAPSSGTSDTLTVSSSGKTASAAITLAMVLGPFDHISITPPAPTLLAHSDQTFTAQAYDANNNPLTGAVYSWSTNVGLMNAATGFFTAPRLVGTYQVSAIGTINGVIKSLSIPVTVTPSPFDHIDITGLGAVTSGKTREFTILTNDTYHNETSTDWSVTSSLYGTVNPSAGGGTSTVRKVIYTATASSGAGLITATASGTVQKDRQIGIIPATDPPNMRFIKALYWVGLERSPDGDPGGVNYWTGWANSGTPREIIAATIGNSHERNRLVVRTTYAAALDNMPAPTESYVDAQAYRMDAGLSRRQLKAELLGSADYINQYGTPVLLVDYLYFDVLGRDPDPGGRDYWAGMVSSGRISTSQLAYQLTFSLEYSQKYVDSEYYRVLGRASETGGRDYWAGLMTYQGVSEEYLTSLLYGSQEFYEKF